MKMIVSKGRTLPDAYHKALHDLRKYGERVECRDWNTTCLEANSTIIVEEPLAEPMISKCFIGGPAELQQYVMEILDGILDFEIEKGNWAYTYHDRMVRLYNPVTGGYVNQIDFVVSELRRNPSSRRAVILVRNGSDVDSGDPACLQHLQYFIRNGRLDCMALFRSNDACKASFMNMFALIMLQKRIADALGVPVGQYVHRANSYHCYERDEATLEAYVTRARMNPKGCVENYEGDWQEMMEEAIPDIEKKVEELKNR